MIRYLNFLLAIFILIPIKAIALIEVDITRGNLNPLPIAVSPLSIDNESNKNLKNLVIYLYYPSNISLASKLSCNSFHLS